MKIGQQDKKDASEIRRILHDLRTHLSSNAEYAFLQDVSLSSLCNLEQPQRNKVDEAIKRYQEIMEERNKQVEEKKREEERVQEERERKWREEQEKKRVEEEEKRKKNEEHRITLIENIKNAQDEERRKELEEQKKKLEEEEERNRKVEEELKEIESQQQNEEEKKLLITQNLQKKAYGVKGTGKHEVAFNKEGNELFARAESEGVYEDDSFYGNNALYMDPNNPPNKWRNLNWRRLKQLKCNWKPLKNPVITSGGFGAADILQGQLGDCYFLSALSVIASTRSEALNSLFHRKSLSINDHGMYVVRFFKARFPRTVVIDDRFPCVGDVSKGSNPFNLTLFL